MHGCSYKSCLLIFAFTTKQLTIFQYLLWCYVSMTRMIVIYDRKTGLTEMMAKVVVNGVQTVADVTVELLKVGTPFSIFKLGESDAIIFGSPTHYVDVTGEMRAILESAKWLKQTMKNKFSGSSNSTILRIYPQKNRVYPKLFLFN